MKVMQFLSEGRYLANVVDGKVALYVNGQTLCKRKSASLCRCPFLLTPVELVPPHSLFVFPKELCQPSQSTVTSITVKCSE